MKNKFLFSCLLLLPVLAPAQSFPVTKILDNGSDEKRINFVVLPDGYQAQELQIFKSNALELSNYFFSKSPFKEYKNFFNLNVIEVPSKESGADHPGNASDEASNPAPIKKVDTYFESTFDYASIHRLLVPTGPNIINVLANNFPDYDQVLVLVNSPIYGGSGGWLATASRDGSSSEIMIHEVGHSFANLGDEYWFDCSEAPNRTSISNPYTIKWKDWLNHPDIGIFDIDGNHCYRPSNNCEMRFLNSEFCAVCKEAIIDRIYNLIGPIESSNPEIANVTFDGAPLPFSLELIYPNPNTLKIEWQLDGKTIFEDKTSILVSEELISNGSHSLVALVTDATMLSRSDLRGDLGYTFKRSWTITNGSGPVATNEVEHFFYKIFPNPVQDMLFVEINYAKYLKWSLYDLSGKLIKNGDLQPTDGYIKTQIQITDLNPGNYQLVFYGSDFKKAVPIVKL